MAYANFWIKRAPESLKTGLNAIKSDHPQRLGKREGALPLSFSEENTLPTTAYNVKAEQGEIIVLYGSRSTAFRALGRLMATEYSGIENFVFKEFSPFETRGLMIDCSRNGVMKPEVVMAFMRRAVLMGINMLMLYTEDTYQVPGEPFFGYLRGGYSHDDFAKLDSYAYSLGIEMIPCIETLAHMEQVLQWPPYFHLRDNDNILLAGNEKTYELIRKMIDAISAPFRTNRIHIGMDEAEHLGTGNYRKLYGMHEPFDIMNKHLKSVCNICAERKLKPMIWSDMYFRLGSQTHDYYDLNWTIPDTVIKNIPKGVQFVYWDYDHTDPRFYQQMIANHRKLGSGPIMAGSLGTVNCFWAQLQSVFPRIDACMKACKKEGLKEVFMTMWGDRGTEVDMFSALPAIQYFCEHTFSKDVDLAKVKQMFSAICESDFNSWWRASQIDSIPTQQKDNANYSNISKALLWQDPLLCILEPHLQGIGLKEHYSNIADDLEKAATGDGLSKKLRFPALIARVLSYKVDLRQNLAKAYHSADKQKIRAIVENDISTLRSALDELWHFHRNMWMETNSPFGWEVIECRYGALRARLETLADRLNAYLAGEISSIPELEAEFHDPWEKSREYFGWFDYNRVKTPSCIK